MLFMHRQCGFYHDVCRTCVRMIKCVFRKDRAPMYNILSGSWPLLFAMFVCQILSKMGCEDLINVQIHLHLSDQSCWATELKLHVMKSDGLSQQGITAPNWWSHCYDWCMCQVLHLMKCFGASERCCCARAFFFGRSQSVKSPGGLSIK